ncbi:MAG: class I SAM-dependent methyltransferase [Dehalococcoidales bacterium]|nr:class I SAM-dependent methyltransferase [Dehalococcoidales bacterium]
MIRFIQGERIPLSEDSFINTSTAQFYDEHARRFMGSVYRRFAVKAAGIKTPGKRVLDLGTGSGRLAIELAKARPDWFITGSDISEEMLKIARTNASQAALTDRIDFHQTPAESLLFTDGCFDLVVSNSSLHLWSDPIKVFNEIARVTMPGRYCLIWDNMRCNILNPFLNLLGYAMGMSSSQRRLWLQAIRSSYTIGEVKALLRESDLKDARAKIEPRFLEISIQWKKPV